MTKSIDDLITDIHQLFHDPDHKVDPENLERFGENCKKALQESIEEATTARSPTLRMSKIGTPDRKLWYEMNESKPVEGAVREIDPSLLIKFLYGHILEELVLFLVRESGHLVEGEQDECDIGGIKGHRDCKIDNVVVDVKSASNFAFKKFSTASLFRDDPFGYVAQLSGYVHADPEAEDFGAFLAINKESGELALLKVDGIDMINPEERIEHVKNMVQKEAPPTEKCYEPMAQNKDPDKDNGNRVLHWSCTYCPFMQQCWQDANGGKGLRSFQYANGKVTHFTEIASEPRVPEITDDLKK